MVVPGTFRNNINLYRNEYVLYEFLLRAVQCIKLQRIIDPFLEGFYSLESESKRENRGSSDIYRLQVDVE